MMYLIKFLLATLPIVTPSQSQDEKVCTLKENCKDKMFSKVMQMAIDCLWVGQSELPQYEDNQNLEGYQNYSRQYCEMRPRYDSCLDQLTDQSASCQIETRHQMFLTLKEGILSSLTIFCKDDANLLANLQHGFRPAGPNRFNELPFKKCVDDLGLRLKLITSNPDFELAGPSIIFYQEAKHLKKCVREYQGADVDEFYDHLQTYLEGLIESMTCLRPSDMTRAPCNTVTDTVTLCPITREADQPPIRFQIADRLEKCLRGPDDDFDKAPANDVDWYRNYFFNKCENRTLLQRCLQTSVLMSRICLDENEQERTQWVIDTFQTALEVGCLQLGEPFAVTAANMRVQHNDTTGHGSQHERCIFPQGVPSGEVTETSPGSSNKLMYYRNYRDFRDCFVRRQHGDKMAVFYTKLVFNEVLRSMVCPDAKTDKHVPCHTLEAINSGTGDLCPYSFEDDAVEKHHNGSYQHFVDLGMDCVKLITGYLSEFNADVPLNEYMYNFDGICTRKPLVKHCLFNMVADAGVCLDEGLAQGYEVLVDTLLSGFVTASCGAQREVRDMAALLYALANRKGALEPCRVAVLGVVMEGPSGNVAAHARRLFEAARQFESCVSSNLQEGDETRVGSLAFLGRLLKSMRCVGSDGNTVPCDSLPDQ